MDLFSNRRLVLQWIFILVGMIYISRLFYLQVLDKSYALAAKSNSLRAMADNPPRGLVYDRKGNLILYNKPEYDLMVIPKQVKKMDTAGFCALLNISLDEFRKSLHAANVYSSFLPSVFLKGLQPDDYARIQEDLYAFSGFYAEIRTVRGYKRNAAAHVLGYIGEVDTSVIRRSNNYYRLGDYVGISGIEKYYEDQLRGRRGVKYRMYDNFNRDIGSFEDGRYDTISVPGSNMISTIDINLQEYGERLMQNKIGSVVAIDPGTGEVLSMISSPSYDPSLLSGKDRKKNFSALFTDPYNPLYNRALKAAYPPGSTFKPVMALVGLEDGVINPDQGYMCANGLTIGSLHIDCHGHGPINSVKDALAYSCNSYFSVYFRRDIDQPKFKSVGQGLNSWRSYLVQFGLGVRTGIDLPYEGYGFIPDAAYYNRKYKGTWNSVTVISLGIGQAEMGITPLQLANMSAAIANRGYFYTPHVIRHMDGDSSALERFHERHMIHIDRKWFDVVVEGMQDVVTQGTASNARIEGIDICGKTGTAQNPHGANHSLFICFAPKEHPKIAIGAIVENSGFGNDWAAPIASLMIEKYMNDSIATSRKWLEKKMMEGNLLH